MRSSFAMMVVLAWSTRASAQPGGEYRCEPGSPSDASLVLPLTLVGCEPAPPIVPGEQGPLGINIKTAPPPPAAIAAEPPTDPRIEQVDTSAHGEFGIGMVGGTFHLGTADDCAIGVGGEAGVRFDRLALLGEYALLFVSAHPDGCWAKDTNNPNPAFAGRVTSVVAPTPAGWSQRFGALARYSVAKVGGHGADADGRGDLFVETGGGLERVALTGGGVVDRPDVEVGVGASVMFRGPGHHFGISLGMRAVLAPSPGPSSGGDGTDLTVLANSTFVFGG